MKLLLLLILYLTTGCESEVRACHHRWAEITCKYPETNNKYQNIDVVLSNGTPVQSFKKDVWEENGRFVLYHDTKNKNLKVAIKHVEEREFGKYSCRFFQRSNSPDIQEGKLETEHANCPRTYLSVYTTANSTITCGYPDVYESHIKFFCKKNRFTCEDILSTSKGTFTLTGSSRAFNISISHVTSQDAGDYWCGVESNDGSYRLSHTQIHLKVIDIQPLTSTIGQNSTYQCKYNQDASSCIKFICKGEDSTVCKQLVTSTEPDVNQRFIMKENSGSITITVREVTANDSGIYWCGARVPHKHNQTHDDFFDGFHLILETGPPLTTATTAAPQSSVMTLILRVAGLQLMFAIILFLIYK
ncbi:polymeric immunoglobulin receptor-like, partial [Pundamilia nyererei]|uniref:polymeric immunoglobulin receptor-like n=1 Tax=Pundamilia nyererei TaxID=303518 RepID=UPI0006AB1EAF